MNRSTYHPSTQQVHCPFPFSMLNSRSLFPSLPMATTNIYKPPLTPPISLSRHSNPDNKQASKPHFPHHSNTAQLKAPIASTTSIHHQQANQMAQSMLWDAQSQDVMMLNQQQLLALMALDQGSKNPRSSFGYGSESPLPYLFSGYGANPSSDSQVGYWPTSLEATQPAHEPVESAPRVRYRCMTCNAHPCCCNAVYRNHGSGLSSRQLPVSEAEIRVIATARARGGCSGARRGEPSRKGSRPVGVQKKVSGKR